MYTQEEIEILKTTYLMNPSKQAVSELAITLGKSEKSIIGKLSRLGIYEKQQYRSKTGELPITKREIVHQIATKLTLDLNELNGLEKAPKITLRKLRDAL